MNQYSNDINIIKCNIFNIKKFIILATLFNQKWTYNIFIKIH